jgi:hypothetical protein
MRLSAAMFTENPLAQSQQNRPVTQNAFEFKPKRLLKRLIIQVLINVLVI